MEECLRELRELDHEIDACNSKGDLDAAHRMINRFHHLCGRARPPLH